MLILLPLFLLLIPQLAFSNDNDGFEIKASTEVKDRNVDHVAMDAQNSAISKLTKLLNRNKGTGQEPVLLARLADLQQQNASIKFRIAHGSAHAMKLKINLDSYKLQMKQSILTLTQLINKYPNYVEIPEVYFMRGKGYEEIGEKEKASKDYMFLVKYFPEADHTIGAYMALAEFAIESNDHPKAIKHLLEVEKHSESPYYPFALYKLAWSNYNLKDIARALSYIERHIQYYNQHKEKYGKEATSTDDALRDNSLLDSTLFYIDGYEKKLSQYQSSEALAYFRKLESGPILGKMMVKFANLLRSHGLEEDLVKWKDQVISEEFKRPEALDVIIIAYDNQLNRHRYSQLVESSKDIVKLYKVNKTNDNFIKAQKLLLDTAESLQSLIIKNKNADGLSEYSSTLAAIYDSFTKIVEDSDPRIPQIHYNLAETLFQVKDFDQATIHYRWIVDHKKGKMQKDKGIDDAGLKAIGSRYEVLVQKNLIPKELIVVKLETKQSKDLDTSLSEWIGWVDLYIASASLADNFTFEANRALYQNGQVQKSVDRLNSFAIKNPSSKFAIPSATLVLDTYIETGSWEKLQQLSVSYLRESEWKGSSFNKRLMAVASDSTYKLIEAEYQNKNYEKTLTLANDFIVKYSKAERFSDCLYLAGNAALALNNNDLANSYYSKLILESPNSTNLSAALLSRATISENLYVFINAAEDYKRYLNLPSTLKKNDKIKEDDIRRKVLIYGWLSGDKNFLRKIIFDKTICTQSLISDCDKYNALSQENINFEMAWKNFKRDRSENKTLWAIFALDGSRSLSYRDRLVLVRQIASEWDSLDSLVKVHLTPITQAGLQKVFQINRMIINDIAPLRSKEAYIVHRVDVIKENENAAAKVMKLPWVRTRAVILSEMAGFYLDFARGIQALAGSTGEESPQVINKIILPFEEKGQEMRLKAFKMASNSAIEDDSFNLILTPFSKDNPSQVKGLSTLSVNKKNNLLNVDLLKSLDLNGGWSNLDPKDQNSRIKSLWLESLAAKKLNQVAFFLNEMRDKKVLSLKQMTLVKSLSLAASGSRGEGLAEIEENLKYFSPTEKLEIKKILIGYFSKSFCKEKVLKLDKEILEVEDSNSKTVVTK